MPVSVKLIFFASFVFALGAVACFSIGANETEPMVGLIPIMAGVIVSLQALGLSVVALMLWDSLVGLPFLKKNADQG